MENNRTVGRGTAGLFIVVLFGQLFGFMAPSAGLAQTLVPVAELPPVVSEAYTVQVGDVLNVNFFKTTDLNQEVTVGPDGELFLPMVGRVDVLNKTVETVTQELMERYGEEMINPQITVSVREFSGMLVYMGGEVRRPGIRPYRGGLTLIQAITESGGFTDRAKKKAVMVVRRGPDDVPVGAIINVKEILKQARLDKDIQLAPEDIVVVPHKKVANVNIWVDQYIRLMLPFGTDTMRNWIL